jgi:hypothetical protein
MRNSREDNQGFIRPGMTLGLGLVVLFILVNVVLLASGSFENQGGTLEVLGVILAAGLTLAVYSFLYKDNPLFKLAEHIYLGVSVGYSVTVTVHQYLAKQVYVPLIEPVIFPDRADQDPKWVLLIPIMLGMFLLARFIPRYAWLSRYAFAMTVGWGAGLMIPQVVKTYLFKQAEASVIAFNSSPDPWVNVSTAVVFVGVLSVLVYFFFSVKHAGPLKPVSRLGIWYLMIAFGATFGFTVMARISLLTGRALFLLKDWLHLVDK